MKKMFAFVILGILCAIPAMAATTVTGVVTDDMCGRTERFIFSRARPLR
jgi:hypothetical protein